MNTVDKADVSRILVIDDNSSIHQDFKEILEHIRKKPDKIESLESSLFDISPRTQSIQFEIDSAFQGEEGYEMVRKALWSGRPYAVAFVDVRMPPGWDGIKTVEHIWRVDPTLEIVICTAYADHSWEEISERLGVNSDKLLVLKKPFDPIEVQQIVTSLLKKRVQQQAATSKQKKLEEMVNVRTQELRDVQEQCRLALEKMERMQKILQTEKK